MKTMLRSQDLTCPSCIAKIEKALARVEGVGHAEVHFASGKIVVEHDADRAPAEALIRDRPERRLRVEGEPLLRTPLRGPARHPGKHEGNA